jgi:hypothetical protein
MKTLTCSLIALAFASTAAQAQDTHAGHTAPQSAPAETPLPEAPATEAAPAAPDAVPPAADAGVSTGADVTADATTDAAAPATTPAPQASATAVTDTEVTSYATAATKVQAIATDAALDQAAKQQQMAAAVTASGLEPARFNEISTAINTDAELRARIQTALAAQAPANDG